MNNLGLHLVPEGKDRPMLFVKGHFCKLSYLQLGKALSLPHYTGPVRPSLPVDVILNVILMWAFIFDHVQDAISG